MTNTTTIYQRLGNVQVELKAPKNQFNSFAKYKYRSAEDIIEAAKPLCVEHGLVLVISDDIRLIGERYYVTATASVFSPDGQSITVTGHAREEEIKKGADAAQITGAASSYARKYALNGLFAIDDTKDADTDEHRNQRQSIDQSTRSNIRAIGVDDVGELIYAVDPSINRQEPSPQPRADRLNPQVNNAYTGPEIDIDESIKQDFLDAIASARTREEWTELLEAANSNEEPGIREAFWMILVSNAPTFAILKNIIGGAETRNAITRRVAEAARYRSIDAA